MIRSNTIRVMKEDPRGFLLTCTYAGKFNSSLAVDLVRKPSISGN